MDLVDNATTNYVARFQTSKNHVYSDRSLALFLVGIVSLYFISVIRSAFSNVKAPIVGYRQWFEPGWLVRLRFIRGSRPIIRGGYSKFKDSMFKVRRNDADILVISHQHVNDLRNLPDEKISAIQAHIKNLLGHHSTTDIMLKTNIHTRVLQQKLTPSLGNTIKLVKEELDHALEVDFPECEDDWTSVSIGDLILRVVARISARVFLGRDNCRNEEWLSTSIHYTENVFMTVMTLRMFPSSLHAPIARCLPSWWRLRSNLATAKRIISPIIRERRDAQERAGGAYEKPEDLLQWMMDAAQTDFERNPDSLAHIQLLLSLASIHTTTMAVSHAIYDMCAHPEYFEPLRAELKWALSEDQGWGKTTLGKLKKLDSFVKESQRMNPPSQLAFNRIVREPMQLKDGTKLPVGTHFSIASDAVLHDPQYLPGGGDPEAFDGFRYSRLREEEANASRYQFAMTEDSSLHFGHGKFACPGRFFASNEIKMILGHLLLRYDVEYPAGQGRPQNLNADENLYPDPVARILIRKRRSEDEVVG
ncbi:cytochrome P450 monooxygenase [Xylaria palmicola]|nr:cytochrome P450 monooxygenase [Xylaria palmicola]